MVDKSIHKTEIVAYSCEEMYALVADIEQYHQFLPYCASATILADSDDIVQAQMTFAYLGFTYSLVTQNTMYPHQRITMSYLRGDVSALAGEWLFSDLGDGRCEVSLRLSIGLHDGIVYRWFNQVMDQLADTMVDRFVERAYYVYGIGYE